MGKQAKKPYQNISMLATISICMQRRSINSLLVTDVLTSSDKGKFQKLLMTSDLSLPLSAVTKQFSTQGD